MDVFIFLNVHTFPILRACFIKTHLLLLNARFLLNACAIYKTREIHRMCARNRKHACIFQKNKHIHVISQALYILAFSACSKSGSLKDHNTSAPLLGSVFRTLFGQSM